MTIMMHQLLTLILLLGFDTFSMLLFHSAKRCMLNLSFVCHASDFASVISD
jgi:hypothetical protein